MYGFCDILNGLLAEVYERKRQRLANLIPNGLRYAETARLAQGFQSSGNVDAVTKYIIFVEDDVADIDADPK